MVSFLSPKRKCWWEAQGGSGLHKNKRNQSIRNLFVILDIFFFDKIYSLFTPPFLAHDQRFLKVEQQPNEMILFEKVEHNNSYDCIRVDYQKGHRNQWFLPRKKIVSGRKKWKEKEKKKREEKKRTVVGSRS